MTGERHTVFLPDDELGRALASKEGQAFRASFFDHSQAVFNNLTTTTALDERIRSAFRLDLLILFTAADAAFADLHRDQISHRSEGGPSGEKVAAAVICWCSRFRPVQVVKSFPSSDWGQVLMVNPIFSLTLGLSMGAAIVGGDERQGPDILSIVMEAEGEMGELLYALQWRAPSYQEFSTLLSVSGLLGRMR